MTLRMLHLTMWYAGREPSAEWRAAMRLAGSGSDFMCATLAAGLRNAFAPAGVEQHR